MGILGFGGVRLDDAGRAALARLLGDPLFELIPLKNTLDQAAAFPAGARVSVTASPSKTLEATFDLAEKLAAGGLRVTPHLSARMTRDRAHLAELLARAREGGFTHVFVVGGDADEPGEFLDGLSLLQAMAELGHPFTAIGVPAYPQGHPDIPGPKLLPALRDKAAFADHYTTQLCFDVGAIDRFVAERVADGLPLRAVIGTPGVAEPQKLLSIAARIGVADAKRFVTKNLGFVLRLARSGGFYTPTDFTRRIAALAARPDSPIDGLHIYTFNAAKDTEAWRREQLERLEVPVPA